MSRGLDRMIALLSTRGVENRPHQQHCCQGGAYAVFRLSAACASIQHILRTRKPARLFCGAAISREPYATFIRLIVVQEVPDSLPGRLIVWSALSEEGAGCGRGECVHCFFSPTAGLIYHGFAFKSLIFIVSIKRLEFLARSGRWAQKIDVFRSRSASGAVITWHPPLEVAQYAGLF